MQIALVCLTLVLASAVVLAPAAHAARPMTVDDLFAFKRVADPQISPDGKQVVYVVDDRRPGRRTRPSSTIWLAPTDGGAPRQLTNGRQEGPPSALQPRRQADPLRVQPLRRQPALGHRPGRRRGPAADHHHHRGRRPASGRPTASRSPSSRPSSPSIPRSRSPRATPLNKKRKEEIEKNPVKAKVFTKLFYPPLGRVRRGQAAAPVRHAGRRAASRAT